MSKYFLLTLVLFVSPYLSATGLNESEFLQKFSNACTSNYSKATKSQLNICSCIGKKHWELARDQPNKKDAEPQLEWLIKYYSKEKPSGFDEDADPYFLTDPSGYDYAFADQCAQKFK